MTPWRVCSKKDRFPREGEWIHHESGLRNDDGLVKKIVNLNKDDLSKHVNKRSSHKMCFNFLKKFFDLVKGFCSEENCLYIAKRTINNDRIDFKAKLVEGRDGAQKTAC